MKKILIITFFLVAVLPFSLVFAQSNPTPGFGNNPNPTPTFSNNAPNSKLQNPLKVTSIKEIIFLAVNIMVYIGVSFAILAIIFVGFKFVMAQGKPEEISKAKEWFLYIIIGLAILISAKVIVEIIQNTLVKSGVVNEKLWEP